MPRQSHIPIHAAADLKPHCRLCVRPLHPLSVRPCHFISPYNKLLVLLCNSGPNTSRSRSRFTPLTDPLTDLQYVVHAAALQQSDAPAERQPRLVAALPATSDLLPAGVERRVHADLPLAPRERPVNDPPLNGLRDPLETLLHPLERPLLRDFPRRDVQQGLRVLGFARAAGRRAAAAAAAAAARSPRGPLALPTRRAVSRSTAEPLGRGLLYALRHDSSASNGDGGSQRTT